MQKHPDPLGNKAVAVDAGECPSKGTQAVALHRLGYRLVAVRPGSKAPMFTGWQTMDYTEDDLWRLFEGSDLNVGIRTGGDLVVLDIDSSDPAKFEWVREHVGDTPMKVLTPGGGQHWYFAARSGVVYGNGVRLRGEPYDLRWNGTQAVCPWSTDARGAAYLWAGPILPVSGLPPMNVSPLRERKRPVRRPAVRGAWQSFRLRSGINDIRLYIRRIPSIQGQNGSRGLMRVCYLLVEDGQDFDRALSILEGWNGEMALPPWSEDELVRALGNAFRKKLGGIAGDGRR